MSVLQAIALIDITTNDFMNWPSSRVTRGWIAVERDRSNHVCKAWVSHDLVTKTEGNVSHGYEANR